MDREVFEKIVRFIDKTLRETGHFYGGIWDARNRVLVYDKSKVPAEFLELMKETGPGEVRIAKVSGGVAENYTVVSTDEWKDWMGKDKVPMQDPAFFDERYFMAGDPKSPFGLDYTWDNFKGVFEAEAREVVEHFRPRKMLDVGCGRGFLCKAVKALGVESYGFDISQWAVDNAEPEVRSCIERFEIDGKTPWPYADDSFDMVAAFSIFEHLEPDVIAFALREACRISSKWVNIWGPVSSTKENMPWGDSTHRTVMPVSWWISEAWKAGLLFNWQRTTYTVKKIGDNLDISASLAFQKGELDLFTD